MEIRCVVACGVMCEEGLGGDMRELSGVEMCTPDVT